ncbi:hypothetical protein [Mameliella sediminis]|uniref:hypothetical protein n=1 Tax=Mameliella sediminis TaxID=2836866 RepID=UPI001C44FF34|nr:hypothetical protein [Mameliella sediminis]MBV7396277.1 hypothetical protein [Mameliella sediminis]
MQSDQEILRQLRPARPPRRRNGAIRLGVYLCAALGVAGLGLAALVSLAPSERGQPSQPLQLTAPAEDTRAPGLLAQLAAVAGDARIPEPAGYTPVNAPNAKPARVQVQSPAPSVHVPRFSTQGMDRDDKLTLAMQLSARGLTPKMMKLHHDGLSPGAREEWIAMRDGKLPADHPAYALRQQEIARDLNPGSCLQLASRDIYCGDTADRIRVALDLRRQVVAGPSVDETEKLRARPVVNRPGEPPQAHRRHGSETCGGVEFCRVVAD